MENRLVCSYCGAEVGSTDEDLAQHLIKCRLRPELGLMLKIEVLEKAGDALIEVVRNLGKAVALVEGMRTHAWEIVHSAEDAWNASKEVNPEELRRVFNEALDEMEAKNEEDIQSVGTADDGSDGVDGASQDAQADGEGREGTEGSRKKGF